MQLANNENVDERDLAWLWYDSDTNTEDYVRRQYQKAVQRQLAVAFYEPLFAFCEANGVALCGHPMNPDDYGLLAYFHIPGQDIVLKQLLPGHCNALTGPDSTQGKCSSDAARHSGKRRNSNECFGGYGWSLTVSDMKWIMDWLFIRGVNVLHPHAFYYSVRGERSGERPPDVGPHNLWWPHFKRIAEYIKRMCWMNTDSCNSAEVAILTDEYHLSWRAAKPLYQAQIEFNYISEHEVMRSKLDKLEGTMNLGCNRYRVLILPEDYRISAAMSDILLQLQLGGVSILGYMCKIPHLKMCSVATDEGEFVKLVDLNIPRKMLLEPPCSDMRASMLKKGKTTFVMVMNEGQESYEGMIRFPGMISARYEIWDAWNGSIKPADSSIRGDEGISLKLGKRECLVVVIDTEAASIGSTQLDEASRGQDYQYSSISCNEITVPFDQAWMCYGLPCGPVRVKRFGSWAEYAGCENFSGTVRYFNRFHINDLSDQYVLDCGQVGDFMEVRVNKKHVDVRFWEPYEVNITDWLNPGVNLIDILVSNSMANHYEKVGRASGLLTGVRMRRIISNNKKYGGFYES
ncbi:hypothetical protein SK3146_05672 [Paenibacillus konkukensis]|uniref:Glycosyl hydrolases family 2 sugar binding domain-containing protein n=1 Tax=Paenibacillus konkukensis TaxID=2020716 RepID=A0ABY4RUT1_9BACL|nr:glycosylhydrolase-like jelly roll fold domain-containing protein [Paenibacillus konkukensis]UQZ86379.1 hypothetical protein SK3146_05672 [Paenibacillus konkukensis]